MIINGTVFGSVKALGGVKSSSCRKQEVPFRIGAPAGVEERHELFGNHSDADIVEAMRLLLLLKIGRKCKSVTMQHYSLPLWTDINSAPAIFRNRHLLVLSFRKFDHLVVKAPIPLVCRQGPVDGIQPLDFLNIMDLFKDSSFFNTNGFRASVLLSVLETLNGFVNIYADLKAFPETFLPLSELLTAVTRLILPKRN